MSPHVALSAPLSDHALANARRTHQVPLIAAWISCFVAVGLGIQSDNLVLGLFGGLLLAGGFTFMAWAAPASRATATFSGVALMSLVGLHIHLVRGATEIHFGVFALLAALVVYRDWLPIVVGAATIATHHASFLWLQQSGFGVYCFTQPTFMELAKHASYVVVESGLLVYLADQMRSDERRVLDVEAVVDAVAIDGEQVDLSAVGRLEVRASQARKLQELLTRIHALVARLASRSARSRSPRARLPAATRTCRLAPSRPPAHCSRPPAQWSSSPARCTRRPIRPAPPISWSARRPRPPSTAARWWPRWSATWPTSRPPAARSPRSSA
ncbi:hypothetical protein [Pseudorhodoferax sp.]|uniref:hypothetical protein n=1 Tax=Pseudorhodoferax sp. TaxID=1993553 RepID=UPI003FA7748E